MIQKKSEDAVSPVIGVMLLLVVTIVLATIVAAFAGGFGTETEAAPATAVDVVSISAGGEEKSGGFLAIKGYPDSEEVPGTYDYRYKCPETGEVFAYYSDNDDELTLVGTNTELHDKYTTILGGSMVFVYNPKVTINSLHGEVLDSSKISVKIYYSDDGFIEGPLTPLSGTLSPGDTLTLDLSKEMIGDNGDHYAIVEGSFVDVVVYYGSHKIAEAENLKVN